MPKLIPLKQWICDKCGGVVEADGGWIEWIDPDRRAAEYHIVHHAAACYFHTHHPNRSDNHLHYYLGAEGLQRFLAELDVGDMIEPDVARRKVSVGDMPSFVDTVRRLHIPYYEEARTYFHAAREDGWFGGTNEAAIHMPDYNLQIIERYEGIEP
jgi:hypothetical protein